MNLSIFREYDIRGLHPTELTADTVSRIGGAFGTVLRERGLKKIAVGGDVRLHTPEIKRGFIAAVLATGIDVVDIGIITSPLCYFSAFHLVIDGFAMITASHNPKEYNGLKLGIGKQTIFGSDIVDIRSRAEKGVFAEGDECLPLAEQHLGGRARLPVGGELVNARALGLGNVGLEVEVVRLRRDLGHEILDRLVQRLPVHQAGRGDDRILATLARPP